MYQVIPYEEAPCEPTDAIAFTTLAEAEAYAAAQIGTKHMTRELAGEQYDDDTIHVCAYYQDANHSSGLWIVRAD